MLSKGHHLLVKYTHLFISNEVLDWTSKCMILSRIYCRNSNVRYVETTVTGDVGLLRGILRNGAISMECVVLVFQTPRTSMKLHQLRCAYRRLSIPYIIGYYCHPLFINIQKNGKALTTSCHTSFTPLICCCIWYSHSMLASSIIPYYNVYGVNVSSMMSIMFYWWSVLGISFIN